MLSSRGVRARRLVPPLVSLFLLVAHLLPAQRPEPPEPPVILATGSASVAVDGRQLDLPYSLTPAGPLFALAPLAPLLGGELEENLAGHGYTLKVAGNDYLVGPDSDVAVVGERIVPLTQRPLWTAAGLEVPLDLLETSFGESLGFSFSWAADARSLEIERLRLRELPVLVDSVHIRGTTTVVLQFPEAAPRYRIVEEPRRIDVEMLGDRVRLAGPPPRFEDPLVDDVAVSPERIVLALAAGAQAANYVLRRPFRLVFDVRQGGVAAAEPPPLAPPSPRSGVRTIVIDPGHGGTETGAVGKSGAVEKDLTLLLAQSLKRRLEQRLPVRVVLTRNEDANLPLQTRTAIANQNKADLFISLHLNSSKGAQPHGAETYFLSLKASDQYAAASAERENQAAAEAAAAGSESAAAGGEGDPLFDLQLILWDLAQSRYLAESQQLAKLIQEELNTTLGLKDRGVKQAPFTVLMGAAMPAVLVELGFLSNPEEDASLQEPTHRAELVEAIVRAVSRFRAQVEEQPVLGGAWQ
jgi:N-acetylmuramoyl-L-alanine amidase